MSDLLTPPSSPPASLTPPSSPPSSEVSDSSALAEMEALLESLEERPVTAEEATLGVATLLFVNEHGVHYKVNFNVETQSSTFQEYHGPLDDKVIIRVLHRALEDRIVPGIEDDMEMEVDEEDFYSD